MTNALISQNFESKDAVLMDALLQTNASSNNIQTKEVSENSQFSNFMSSLDARVKKAQNNFDKKAQISNTSSINKKALEKPAQAKVSKQETDSIKFENKQEVSIKNNSKKDISKPKEINTIAIKEKNVSETSEFKKEENTNIEKNIIKSDTVANKANFENNSSDTNNDFNVELSSVFIDEEPVLEDVALKEEIIPEKIVGFEELVSSDVLKNSVKVQEDNEIIEDILSKIETLEDADKLIKEIASIFANLNQNQENNLASSLEDIKEYISQNNIETEEIQKFDEILVQVKNQLSEALSKVDTNSLNQILDFSKNQLENYKVQAEIVSVENTIDLKNEIEKVDKLTKDLLEELNKLVNSSEGENVSLIKELKESLLGISEELPKKETFSLDDIKKIESTVKEIKELASKINLNETIKDDVLKLDKIVQGLSNEESKILKADFSKNKSKDFSNSSAAEELIQIDTDKIDFSSKKSMNELLNLLEDFGFELNNSDKELNLDEKTVKDINKKIENLMDDIQNIEISADDIKQAIDEIQQDAKVVFNNAKKTTQNIIDISAKLNNSDSDSFSQKDSNSFVFANDIEVNQSEELFENIDVDFDINQEPLFKGKVERNDVKSQENLSKTAYEKNILKDILASNVDDITVEVNIKNIPTQSGALSAQDEVAKFALGEQSSLNPVTSVHGSVTYDSVGANVVLKNVAQLMKATQLQETQNPSMEEVLNQVSNKITQLKDTNSQKLTMVLRPNDLGRLSIELVSNNQGLTTMIMAQNEDVRAYIEKNIDSLRQQLSDAGVNVNSIQIKTSGQEGSTTYEGNQNLKQEQDGLNQENKNNSQNQQSGNKNRDNKEMQNILASVSNYDVHFAKDFSSILNKSLNYGN